MTDAKLIELAQTMLERAYAPYSHFPVGAALEADDGQVFTGCNVENAAYGQAICAERTAVVKAVSQGVRSFRRIAIVAGSDDPCFPCGACRQVLSEFSPTMTVLCANRSGAYTSLPLSDLLPHSFGPAHLDHKE